MKYECGTSLGLLLLFLAHTTESGIGEMYDEHNIVEVEVRLWNLSRARAIFSQHIRHDWSGYMMNTT